MMDSNKLLDRIKALSKWDEVYYLSLYEVRKYIIDNVTIKYCKNANGKDKFKALITFDNWAFEIIHSEYPEQFRLYNKEEAISRITTLINEAELLLSNLKDNFNLITNNK